MLLPGIHNGLGTSACVTKRVVIVGGEARALTSPLPTPPATLDFRGNAPDLRFERVAAVVSVSIDATGWREAVRVDGPPSVTVSLADCTITASGDDGVLVAGGATATLTRCAVKAGRHGVVVAQRGSAALHATILKSCGGSGCVATQDGSVTLSHNTIITDCGADGVRVSGRGRVEVAATRVARCSGPALDVSSDGQATVGAGCEFTSCAGGVWAWGGGQAAVGARARVDGGETFALLSHGYASLVVDAAAIVSGAVSGAAASTAASACSSWMRPPGYVGPPPEAGPFRWDGDDVRDA